MTSSVMKEKMVGTTGDVMRVAIDDDSLGLIELRRRQVMKCVYYTTFTVTNEYLTHQQFSDKYFIYQTYHFYIINTN